MGKRFAIIGGGRIICPTTGLEVLRINVDDLAPKEAARIGDCVVAALDAEFRATKPASDPSE